MAPSAEVESVKKATVTHCTPKSGYDTCYEIDNQDLEYWQTTLPDPDWRTIEPSSEPGIDVEVTVETEDLNAGVIPTASGQGHYNDWDDYQSALDSLLGVDTDQYDVALRVKGPTLKLDDSQEPTAATTGVFRFDALSNEDGEIYIDGQDETSVLMEDGFGNDHKITYDDGSGSSTINSGDANDDGGASTQSSHIKQAVLQGGNWTALFQLAVFGGNNNIGYWLEAQISDVAYNGLTCWWDMDFQSIERHCAEAEWLAVHLYGEEQSGNREFDGDQNQNASATENVAFFMELDYVGSCAEGRAHFDGQLMDEATLHHLLSAQDCPLPDH